MKRMVISPLVRHTRRFERRFAPLCFPLLSFRPEPRMNGKGSSWPISECAHLGRKKWRRRGKIGSKKFEPEA
jgi:hypothetical protein